MHACMHSSQTTVTSCLSSVQIHPIHSFRMNCKLPSLAYRAPAPTWISSPAFSLVHLCSSCFSQLFLKHMPPSGSGLELDLLLLLSETPFLQVSTSLLSSSQVPHWKSLFLTNPLAISSPSNILSWFGFLKPKALALGSRIFIWDVVQGSWNKGMGKWRWYKRKLMKGRRLSWWSLWAIRTQPACKKGWCTYRLVLKRSSSISSSLLWRMLWAESARDEKLS